MIAGPRPFLHTFISISRLSFLPLILPAAFTVNIYDRRLSLPLLHTAATAVHSTWSKSSLEKYVDVLELAVPVVPVVGAEFIGSPHHHRTPFAVTWLYILHRAVRLLHTH